MTKGTATKESKTAWLLRGRTRLTVARAVKSPMDGPGIAKAASKLRPAIERVQTGRILRQLLSKGLVECLTPQRVTGKIYGLTPVGARILGRVFGSKGHSTAAGIDWNVYSRVMNHPVMPAILRYLRKLKNKGPQDAAEMRRRLAAERALSYEGLYRALSYLTSQGLVRYCGQNLSSRHRLYMITESGEKMAEQLSMAAG